MIFRLQKIVNIFVNVILLLRRISNLPLDVNVEIKQKNLGLISEKKRIIKKLKSRIHEPISFHS